MPSRSVLGAGSFVGIPPDPARYANWKDYAIALAAYVSDGSRVEQATQAQAVQLIHVDTSGTKARATSDGLLVFDPVLGKPVISIGGVWKQFDIIP